mgnify:CR=1 FL=1
MSGLSSFYDNFEPPRVIDVITIPIGSVESNETIDFAFDYLKNCPVLIITFGTSYVYAFGNKVVANCHKQPSNTFNSFNLSIDDITNDYDILIQKLKIDFIFLDGSKFRQFKNLFSIIKSPISFCFTLFKIQNSHPKKSKPTSFL